MHPVGGLLGVAADILHFLEEVGHLAAGGQHAGVIGGQTQFAFETCALLGRQFRQGLAQVFDVGLVHFHRQQVRAREVAVIVGFFLGAHAARLVSVRIIQAGFLHDLAAVLDQLDLTLHLEVDGTLDEAEGVDVLDLRAGAEGFLALGAHRDVDVATQGTFGHVAVGDAQVGDDGVDRLHVGHRFLGGTHVRLGDDFQQRRAGTVEVDTGHALEVFMQRLAGIFLEVGMVDADRLARAIFQKDLEHARTDDGLIHLAGLVALGQIRVEVVFPLEHGAALNLRIHCQAKHDRIAESLLVGDRQRAGHGQVNGVGLRVRLGAVSGAGA